MDEIDKYFICGPMMAICINTFIGIMFFIIAVLIDSKN